MNVIDRTIEIAFLKKIWELEQNDKLEWKYAETAAVGHATIKTVYEDLFIYINYQTIRHSCPYLIFRKKDEGENEISHTIFDDSNDKGYLNKILKSIWEKENERKDKKMKEKQKKVLKFMLEWLD